MSKIWVEEPLYRLTDLFPWQVPEQWALAEHSLEADWLLIRASSSPEELAQQQRAYSKISLSEGCRVQLVNLWWIADGVDTDQYITAELAKYHWLHRPVEYLHTNRRRSQGFYDLLWNRHKFYFTEADTQCITTHWTEGHSQLMYELADIPLEKTASKLWLSANRIYPDHLSHSERLQRRAALVRVLEPSETWISDQTQRLEAQQTTDYLKQKLDGTRDSIWQPIHNRYYLDSYCSVYVETLVGDGATQSITEKTLDPLIKGHFILPYAYPGFGDNLRDMGFLLPRDLDLSYLDDKDPDQRWRLFCREIERNRHRDWPSFYRENRDLLLHNRRLFWNRPYSRIPL